MNNFLFGQKKVHTKIEPEIRYELDWLTCHVLEVRFGGVVDVALKNFFQFDDQKQVGGRRRLRDVENAGPGFGRLIDFVVVALQHSPQVVVVHVEVKVFRHFSFRLDVVERQCGKYRLNV